jgi:hypothetical protein
MKWLIILTALALFGAGSFVTQRYMSAQSSSAADAGAAIAEMHETFAQREKARVAEVNAALEAKRRHEQDENARREAHDAVWAEIKRQQALEK